MKKFLILPIAVFLAVAGSFVTVRAKYPLLYEERSLACGVDPRLACAVMKAESGFRTDRVSRAGAVGLMQLLPSTAKFVCEREGIDYREEALFEGDYNVTLGCRYLSYLGERFSETKVVLAAYNAGEGVVSDWLASPALSDGRTLKKIPYPETERYVKKVMKFKKIYDFFY